jgi:hypothetical protein
MRNGETVILLGLFIDKIDEYVLISVKIEHLFTILRETDAMGAAHFHERGFIPVL